MSIPVAKGLSSEDHIADSPRHVSADVSLHRQRLGMTSALEAFCQLNG